MHTDIYQRLRSDSAFYDSLMGLIDAINKNPTPAKLQEIVLAVFRLCDFNGGVLVPFFFPKAMGGAPLSLMARPFAFALMSIITHGYMAIEAARQVAKSTTLCVRQLVLQYMLPDWHSLYLAPHTKHTETYARKLHELELKFRYWRVNRDVKQNMYFKQSPNGNGSSISLDHVLSSAAHIHGRTCDEVAFDEYQFFDPDLENEILMVTTSRPIKSRVYAGTAFTLDSPLHERFEDSTAATWHIRGRGSKDWLNMGDRDTILSCICPDGLRDPVTRIRLDVSDGQWVDAHSEQAQVRKFGFHVPRLIIPDMVEDVVRWSEIYTEFTETDTTEFLKNVCGLGSESADREITRADLEAMCTGETAQERQRKAINNEYIAVVSSADWGGSELDPVNRVKTSFSVHVMWGLKHDGDVDIIYMRRYPGQDYRETAQRMASVHHQLKGTAFASDAGAGMGYNRELRDYIDPRKHLIMHLTSPHTAPMSPISGAPLTSVVGVNKTEAITALFQGVKRRPAPRITCFKWEQARDYLLDFMNSRRVPTENLHGRRYFRFIRPASKSDDTMMSCMFGYVLVRLMYGEPLVQDPAMKQYMRHTFSLLTADRQTRMRTSG